MENFITVASVEEFADGRRKTVQIEGREVAIFKIADEFYAIGNECPHHGAPLCEGYVDGELVSCPWHGWQFDLQTGEGMTVPGIDVPAYTVEIENGHVKIAAKR